MYLQDTHYLNSFRNSTKMEDMCGCFVLVKDRFRRLPPLQQWYKNGSKIISEQTRYPLNATRMLIEDILDLSSRRQKQKTKYDSRARFCMTSRRKKCFLWWYLKSNESCLQSDQHISFTRSTFFHFFDGCVKMYSSSEWLSHPPAPVRPHVLVTLCISRTHGFRPSSETFDVSDAWLTTNFLLVTPRNSGHDVRSSSHLRGTLPLHTPSRTCSRPHSRPRTSNRPGMTRSTFLVTNAASRSTRFKSTSRTVATPTHSATRVAPAPVRSVGPGHVRSSTYATVCDTPRSRMPSHQTAKQLRHQETRDRTTRKLERTPHLSTTRLHDPLPLWTKSSRYVWDLNRTQGCFTCSLYFFPFRSSHPVGQLINFSSHLWVLVMNTYSHSATDHPEKIKQMNIIFHNMMTCVKWRKIKFYQITLYRNVLISFRKRLYIS